MNKVLLIFFIFFSLISNIFSYINKNLEQGDNLLKDAVLLIEKEKEKVFKNFSEYKTKWFNKDNFILVIDSKGKCLINENTLRHSNFIVMGKALDYVGFCDWILKEVNLTDNLDGIIYYLSSSLNLINPELKAFIYKKVFVSNDKWYIVATIKDSLFLEEQLVKDELDLCHEILIKKGFSSFPILRIKSNIFFGDKNFIFIINEKGDVLFNTGEDKNFKEENIINNKDAMNKFYIKNLLDKSKTQDEGQISYFSQDRNSKYAYNRNIFFKTAKIKEKKILICYNVKFPKSSYISVDKNQDNAIRIQFLAKKIIENIENIGYLEFKKNYLNNNISFLKEIQFFILDGNTQDVLFDSMDKLNKNKINIKFIKNTKNKSIWKNIKLVLENNNDRGWVYLSVPNKQDEFSLIKKGEDLFVYIIGTKINEKFYIVCVPSNLQNIKKEIIEENSDIIKTLFTKEMIKKTEISDIRDLLLNVSLSGNRFFIVDMKGNLVLDSEILYKDTSTYNFMKVKDINGKYIIRNVLLNLKYDNDSHWENFDIKTLEGGIKEKAFYFNRIDVMGSKYVIVIESDLNI